MKNATPIGLNERILYGAFIKYEKMNELTLQNLSYSSSNELNVFIDMYSLLLPLYRNNVRVIQDTGIASCIINLCAHIRNYYWNAHKVNTKFYIVHSTNAPASSRQFYPEYNFHAESTTAATKTITGLVELNCEILSVLCPYLPDIFFIQDFSAETGVIVYDLIQKIGNPTIPNLVISKDTYMYQLPAIDPNTIVFRPHKTKGEDGSNIESSYAINHNTVFETFCLTEKGLNQSISGNLDSSLFSLVIALSGLPSRTLYSLFKFPSAYRIVDNGVTAGVINNAYSSDADFTLSRLTFNVESAPPLMVVDRFRAFDLLYQYYLYTNSVSSTTNTGTIVNLYDPNAVREINNKYFAFDPLDLNRL